MHFSKSFIAFLGVFFTVANISVAENANACSWLSPFFAYPSAEETFPMDGVLQAGGFQSGLDRLISEEEPGRYALRPQGTEDDFVEVTVGSEDSDLYRSLTPETLLQPGVWELVWLRENSMPAIIDDVPPVVDLVFTVEDRLARTSSRPFVSDTMVTDRSLNFMSTCPTGPMVSFSVERAPLALYITEAEGDISPFSDQAILSSSNGGGYVSGSSSFTPITFRVGGLDEAGRFSGWSELFTANPPPPGCSAIHLSKDAPNLLFGLFFGLGIFTFRRRGKR